MLSPIGELGIPVLSPPSREKTVEITDALYRSIAKIPPRPPRPYKYKPEKAQIAARAPAPPPPATRRSQSSAIHLPPRLRFLAGFRPGQAEPCVPGHGRRTRRGTESPGPPHPWPLEERLHLPRPTAPREVPTPRPRDQALKPPRLEREGWRPAIPWTRPRRRGAGGPLRGHGEKPGWGKGRPRGACSDPHKRDRVPPAPASREAYRRQPAGAVRPKRALPALPRADGTENPGSAGTASHERTRPSPESGPG